VEENFYLSTGTCFGFYNKPSAGCTKDKRSCMQCA